MAGFFLIFFGILFLLFLIISIFKLKRYNDDNYVFPTVIFGLIFFFHIIAIPISQINTKTTILEIEQLRIVIKNSRIIELSEFERFKLIETITEYNEIIANWKTKGEKWYNNKWYYYPICKDVDFLK